jgi:hypothetical protein
MLKLDEYHSIHPSSDEPLRPLKFKLRKEKGRNISSDDGSSSIGFLSREK